MHVLAKMEGFSAESPCRCVAFAALHDPRRHHQASDTVVVKLHWHTMPAERVSSATLVA